MLCEGFADQDRGAEKEKTRGQTEILIKRVEELSSLERAHKKTHSLEQAGKLKLLRDEIKDLLSCSVRCKLLYQRRTYYEIRQALGQIPQKRTDSNITDANRVR